jgi:hypothetical protein
MFEKKAFQRSAGRLFGGCSRSFKLAAFDYIVSMKLRSLSLRLGCFNLRSALASI